MKFSTKSVLAIAMATLVAGAQAAGATWLTSYQKALQVSAKTGKPILADFTGTTWCIYCKKLDAEVFSTPEFKQWAAKNVVLLKLDFPEEMPSPAVLRTQPELAARYELTKKYRIEGFPTIYFLRSNGKAFGMFGYQAGGPVRWTTLADRLVNPHKPAAQRVSATVKGYPDIINKTLYADVDLRGKKAPKLVVEKWLNGKAPKTDGKVVLVDFWASWCPGCREIIPELAQWQKKYGKDLVVIGVTDEDPQKVAKFMKNTPMNYYVAIDRTHNMYRQIGIQSIPHALVITPDHVVRWQGFPDLRQDILTEEVMANIISTSKRQTVATRR